MKQELLEMLKLQEEINHKVHPQWREQQFEWYRAIWIESAELLDHYGWKWWKKQSPDLAQVQLELVDIWHFALSMALQTETDLELIADELADGMVASDDLTQNFAETLESFVAKMVSAKQFDVGLFADLLALAEMPFADLYTMYVGKNILNRFRQDHGYQDGSYRKLWLGREDNEHLAEILSLVDQTVLDQSGNFSGWLYQQLKERYQA